MTCFELSKTCGEGWEDPLGSAPKSSPWGNDGEWDLSVAWWEHGNGGGRPCHRDSLGFRVMPLGVVDGLKIFGWLQKNVLMSREFREGWLTSSFWKSVVSLGLVISSQETLRWLCMFYEEVRDHMTWVTYDCKDFTPWTESLSTLFQPRWFRATQQKVA